MRRVLIKVAIVVALLVAMSIPWIFGGRQLSLFLDRFGTVELISAPIRSISYEGNGSGGILRVNDLALSLNSRNPLLRSLEIGTTNDDQVTLSLSGQVFSFGDRRGSQNPRRLTGSCPVKSDTVREIDILFRDTLPERADPSSRQKQNARAAVGFIVQSDELLTAFLELRATLL